MKEQQRKLTSNKASRKWIRKWKESLSIGIWGALIWSFIGYFSYWLNLSDYSPSHFGKPFLNPDYLFRWQGILLSISIVIIMSIILSFIYSLFFSHILTPWIGAALGAVLWYILVGWRDVSFTTLLSTFSLFVLYGIFIGYSLSMEFSSMEMENEIAEKT